MFQPPLSLEDEDKTFDQQFYVWKHGMGPHYQAPFCNVVDSIFSYKRELMAYLYNPYCNISNHFLLVENKALCCQSPGLFPWDEAVPLLVAGPTNSADGGTARRASKQFYN